jgi:L-2-hydroxyglutarate oxidase LhgO
MTTADVAIIGGGIVGMATAYQVARSYPGKKLIVLEKERALAQHQTGHNSGVLHSGIYYKPGSLKARTCREGRKAMQSFCAEHGIPLEICGKVIVATAQGELPRLATLYERARANGVDCAIIGPERLRELEPYATSGIRAIHVPEVGILDYKLVCAKLAELVAACEHQILTSARVHRFRHDGDGLVLETTAGAVRARHVINCGGLHSDRLARLSGQDPGCTIVPFRGEYYHLKAKASHYCRNIIYPVPDPAFPFLGVHFTRRLDLLRMFLALEHLFEQILRPLEAAQTMGLRPRIPRSMFVSSCGAARRLAPQALLVGQLPPRQAGRTALSHVLSLRPLDGYLPAARRLYGVPLPQGSLGGVGHRDQGSAHHDGVLEDQPARGGQ